MSAEVLREAARLMRERAEAATVGPWSAEAIGSEGYDVFGADGTRAPMKGRARVAQCHWQDWDEVQADAEHIASWHPAVALAVADWLDAEAAYAEEYVAKNVTTWTSHDTRALTSALAVARTYLGSDQ